MYSCDLGVEKMEEEGLRRLMMKSERSAGSLPINDERHSGVVVVLVWAASGARAAGCARAGSGNERRSRSWVCAAIAIS